MHAVTAQAWNPTHYDRAGAFAPKLAADLLDLLAPQPGERVLDLGSGTGDLTRALPRQAISRWLVVARLHAVTGRSDEAVIR